MNVELSQHSINLIAAAVAEQLRAPVVAPEVVTIEGAQLMLATKSRRATQKQLKGLGVRQYSRGKYRVADIRDRIARRTREKTAA